MKTIALAEAGMEEVVRRAAAVLQAGGVILYPTDTLYGLGADALSDEAVEKIRSIKGREEGKPLHALVSGLEMAESYGDISDDTRLLAGTLPQGKVSFIVPKHPDVTTGIARDMATFGFRIPDHAFCQALLASFGAPITATSANRSGEEPQATVSEIVAQLGTVAESIDLVIDAGPAPLSAPSTVVDLSVGTHPVILREGAVPADDVWEVIRASVSAIE